MSDEEDTKNEFTLAILRDEGNKVELMLKAHGLKKRKGFFYNVLTKIKKPHEPSKILENGRFTRYNLTPSSLNIELEVDDMEFQTEKRRKNGSARFEVYYCNIREFPCRINPDSASFEVIVPASGQCFILLSFIKLDKLNVNWKDYMATNNTIDMTPINTEE